MIQAAVFTGPRQAFQWERLARPVLSPGEVLVRVRLCTLCGSDLHTYCGRRHGPTPSVLGHEIVGDIEELAGEKLDATGQRLSVGDRVTWTVADSCGACFYCQHELPQKCEQLKKYGHHPHEAAHGPVGGLATHCHLWSGTPIVRVPDSVSDEAAAPAMCATATVAGALRQAGNVRGATVLVLGAGMLGVTACAMATAAGAQVLVSDVNPARLAVAERFGATRATKETLQDLTRGRGADVVLELAGVVESVQTALESVRIGGTVVLLGSVFPVGTLAVNPETVVRRCLRIVGSHNYATCDLVAAMQFLADAGQAYPFAELVEKVLPLAELPEAFHRAEVEKPYRMGIRP